MEEDLKILEEIKKNGTKWAQISKNLIGRNENNVKNRYFTLLGLHSISRQKKSDLLTNEISQRIDSKIKEIKDSLAFENENNNDSYSFTSIISSYINEETLQSNNILKSPCLYPADGYFFYPKYIFSINII